MYDYESTYVGYVWLRKIFLISITWLENVSKVFKSTLKAKTSAKRWQILMWFVQYNVKFVTFWQKFLPSKRFEKFLTRFLVMLLVLEILSLIRRIQRTLIRNHTIDLLQARSIKLWKRAEVENFILFNFNMKLRNIWVLKRSSWLQRALENFSNIFSSRCWYLRCSPRPDTSSAH